MSIKLVALIVFAIGAAVSSQLVFKYWVEKIGDMPFSASGIITLLSRIFQSPLMIGALALYGAGFIAWLYLLSRSQVSVVYPIVLSANIILVSALSAFFFKEMLDIYQIIGIGAIITGIYFLFI